MGILFDDNESNSRWINWEADTLPLIENERVRSLYLY